MHKCPDPRAKEDLVIRLRAIVREYQEVVDLKWGRTDQLLFASYTGMRYEFAERIRRRTEDAGRALRRFEDMGHILPPGYDAVTIRDAVHNARLPDSIEEAADYVRWISDAIRALEDYNTSIGRISDAPNWDEILTRTTSLWWLMKQAGRAVATVPRLIAWAFKGLALDLPSIMRVLISLLGTGAACALAYLATYSWDLSDRLALLAIVCAVIWPTLMGVVKATTPQRMKQG